MVSVASPLSIIVESKTSSTGSWDSDKMHPSPLASHPFRIPTPSFSDLDIPSELQYSSRPMSDLNVAGTRTSYLGGDLHDTVRLGENVRRRRSRDDVAALIEFLRTHEPPPDNFMSQPYNADEDGDRGRWEKLKVMGKKRSKSMSRAPAPIRLPDSAVAGVTTGGHRHIAISIPLDASHFGETPKSQYPVFDQDVQPPVPPLPESVRTFKNEKGVVTVLRHLSPNGDYGSVPPSPASPRRFDRDYPPQLLRNRRLMSSSPPPPSPADSEQWPLSRTESEASSNAQPSTAAREAQTEPQTVTKVSPRQTSEFVRAAYPTRGSSMAASPRIQHHHTSSIDEVIAEEEPFNRNPSPMPREGIARRNTERRLGRPPVSLATSPVARKSTSNMRSEWQADKEAAVRQSRVTQVADSPVINRDESPSPPASIISVKSRREKVRDKKLRDLAAARTSKLSNKPSLPQLKGSDQATASKMRVAPAVNSISSGPKLTNIMVVVDMKPDSDEKAQEPSAAAAAKDDDTESVIEMLPEPVMKLPTPPTSAETSPAQKHGFDTRTSLTRRREWQTSRAQERQKREANAVAKAQLRQLAASGTYAAGLDASSDPEREIFRLYEAYREQRLHDMEARVRRLEKNGDVWLRALVPMLEDVNNNSKLSAASAAAAANGRRPSLKDDESIREWASDDETAAANVDRLQRASARRKLIRRASLSRERMLEELMRREERDMLDAYDDKHKANADASGMGSIEPLMRELAGGLSENNSIDSGSNTATPRARSRASRKLSADAPPIPLRVRPSNGIMRV